MINISFLFFINICFLLFSTSYASLNEEDRVAGLRYTGASYQDPELHLLSSSVEEVRKILKLDVLPEGLTRYLKERDSYIANLEGKLRTVEARLTEELEIKEKIHEIIFERLRNFENTGSPSYPSDEGYVSDGLLATLSAEEVRKEKVGQLKEIEADKPKSASPQAKVKDVLPGNENEREGYVRDYYNAPDGLLAVARVYMVEQGKPLSSNWKDYDTLKKAVQARHPKLFPDKFFNPVEMLAYLIDKSHAEEIMKRMKHRPFNPSKEF